MKTIKNLTAEELRKSILQLAIQGKLVKQNPDDEPASELVKRIYEEKAKLVAEGKIKKDKNQSYIFKGDDNCYYDEDGLSLKVELIDNNYIMTDKDKNTNTFINHSDIYYLEQITDTTNKSINIEYDDINRIVKVIDASNKEEALSIIKHLYNKELIILDDTSYIDTEFKVVE